MVRFVLGCAFAAFAFLVAGCGGSPSPSAAAAPSGSASSPGTASVSGVATPRDVSVVTAKNAQ